MRYISVALLLLATSVTASEPGQPLDCSDWVLLHPGLSCLDVAPYPCEDRPGEDRGFCKEGVIRAIDNDGWILRVRRRPVDVGGQSVDTTELVRFDGTTVEILAYLANRWSDDRTIRDHALPRWLNDATTYESYVESGYFTFDPVRGRVLIPLREWCLVNGDFQRCGYAEKHRVVAITGLTTLFDVMQTYTPLPAIAFRVPMMPEGLPSADSFDTYYGSLTKPIDFAQAQPLACGYPAASPAVGDYLEVADTLPDPSPGTGRYYVTSATYQGQTRYGRKTASGVVTGRDPSVLPACTTE